MSKMSVHHWLQGLNLQQHLQLFEKAGLTNLAMCCNLDDAALQQIGITMPGHRKRILTHLPHDYVNLENFNMNQENKDDHIYANPNPMQVEFSSPALPVKTKKGNIDELMGIKKTAKPVPAPRRSVTSKKMSAERIDTIRSNSNSSPPSHLGSQSNAPIEEEAEPDSNGDKTEHKPRPKPRSIRRKKEESETTERDNSETLNEQRLRTSSIKLEGVTETESTDTDDFEEITTQDQYYGNIQFTQTGEHGLAATPPFKATFPTSTNITFPDFNSQSSDMNSTWPSSSVSKGDSNDNKPDPFDTIFNQSTGANKTGGAADLAISDKKPLNAAPQMTKTMTKTVAALFDPLKPNPVEGEKQENPSALPEKKTMGMSDYEAIWIAKRQSDLMSLQTPTDELKFDLSNSSQPSSRDSTLSFDMLPPSFTPPPLPNFETPSFLPPVPPRHLELNQKQEDQTPNKSSDDFALFDSPQSPEFHTTASSHPLGTPRTEELPSLKEFEAKFPPLDSFPVYEEAATAEQVYDRPASYRSKAPVPLDFLEDPFGDSFNPAMDPEPVCHEPERDRKPSGSPNVCLDMVPPPGGTNHSYSLASPTPAPSGNGSNVYSAVSPLGKPSRPAPQPPKRSTGSGSTISIASDSSIPSLPPPPPPRQCNHSNAHQDDLAIYHFEESSTWKGSIGEGIDKSSEDSLSDGGDEYSASELRDGPKPFDPAEFGSRIPITPTTPVRSMERHGHLHKQGGKQGNKGWRKRWVVFNGKDLRYYEDQKSRVSKRIIPIQSMRNVENDIKKSTFPASKSASLRNKRAWEDYFHHKPLVGTSSLTWRFKYKHRDVIPGDSKQFRFRLYTINRVFIFAADERDDLMLWSSTLMQAILMNKEPDGFDFIHGGDMAGPDKEGFLKIEGIKGKHYVAVKGDRMCYYNNFDDYKVASPIHEIEMKLAAVKDIGKNKLQLITSYHTYTFVCDSPAELQQWKEALEEAIADGLADDTVLQQVYENPSNKNCADCGAPDPHWASLNLGITICKKCSGIHRHLGPMISKIRSLRMDFKVWNNTLIRLFEAIGNDNANNFWEWNVTEDSKIEPDTDMGSRQNFIINKYKSKLFCKFHPLQKDTVGLNEALCKAVSFGNVLETMEILFSGADIHYESKKFGEPGANSPLQLAKHAKQTLQQEFLFQNGAESSNGSSQTGISVSLTRRNLIRHKGYLFKTGSNQKEFHKRYCLLENSNLSYFMDEKAVIAKDIIDIKELGIICSTTNEKSQYCFELTTRKSGNRVYLFAAESAEDQEAWMIAIAKSCVPPSAIDHVTSFEKGGKIFLKDGSTADWKQCWIQMKNKQLSLYNEHEECFDNVDLRKVVGLNHQEEGLCPQAFDKGMMFIIDLKGRALYIQCDLKRDTEYWWRIIQRAATESGDCLDEQQLTQNDVPVIVDKCIKFVSTHGLTTQGIYRLNGTHSKIKQLLEAFREDARSVHLKLEDYEVHDAANALKRYFRTLSDPLLTKALYTKWVEIAAYTDHNAKLQWYQYQLKNLPKVNYNTLRMVVGHLKSVSEHEHSNKMTVINLGSIFGPALMTLDSDDVSGGGFKQTNQEISTIVDMIQYYGWLFEVNDQDQQKEQRIQAAIEKIKKASTNIGQAGDMMIGVYINDRQGDCKSLKVPVTMTTEDMISQIVSQAKLDTSITWGLYEVVCGGELERPLHYSDKVLPVVLRWTPWGEDDRRNSYLCVKANYVYAKLETVLSPQMSSFSELKYSDRKGFKKHCFEFSQSKLSYYKDSKFLDVTSPNAKTKMGAPIASWNVEDLTIYVGAEHKRTKERLCFTFIENDEKVIRSKDVPFFGRTVICNNEEELYRWLAAMYNAQHPEGLLKDGARVNLGSASSIPGLLELRRDSPPTSNSGSPKVGRGIAAVRTFFKKN